MVLMLQRLRSKTEKHVAPQHSSCNSTALYNLMMRSEMHLMSYKWLCSRHQCQISLSNVLHSFLRYILTVQKNSWQADKGNDQQPFACSWRRVTYPGNKC